MQRFDPGGGADGEGYSMLALAAAGYAPDAITDTVAVHTAAMQRRGGELACGRCLARADPGERDRADRARHADPATLRAARRCKPEFDAAHRAGPRFHPGGAREDERRFRDAVGRARIGPACRATKVQALGARAGRRCSARTAAGGRTRISPATRMRRASRCGRCRRAECSQACGRGVPARRAVSAATRSGRTARGMSAAARPSSSRTSKAAFPSNTINGYRPRRPAWAVMALAPAIEKEKK